MAIHTLVSKQTQNGVATRDQSVDLFKAATKNGIAHFTYTATALADIAVIQLNTVV